MAVARRKKTPSRERRRHHRVPLKMPVRYQGLKKGHVAATRRGHSDDVSAGGLCMHSLIKLSEGQLLALNLFIPRGKSPALRSVKTFAAPVSQPTPILSRVVYCEPAPRKRYKLGIQFLDLDKESRKRFREFLLRQRLIKTNSRLYL